MALCRQYTVALAALFVVICLPAVSSGASVAAAAQPPAADEYRLDLPGDQATVQRGDGSGDLADDPTSSSNVAASDLAGGKGIVGETSPPESQLAALFGTVGGVDGLLLFAPAVILAAWALLRTRTRRA